MGAAHSMCCLDGCEEIPSSLPRKIFEENRGRPGWFRTPGGIAQGRGIDSQTGNGYVVFMNITAEKIVEEALELPPEARAFVAERLIESLDAGAPADISPAWREEIRRRCREIDEGTADLRDATEVFPRYQRDASLSTPWRNVNMIQSEACTWIWGSGNLHELMRATANAFWGIWFGGVLAFAISVAVAPLSFAPLAVNGVYIESITRLAVLLLCPVLLIFAFIFRKRILWTQFIAYLGFLLLTELVFHAIFPIWLSSCFSPDKNSVWCETPAHRGQYYYVDRQHASSLGDAKYSGQAWESPPWIQAPPRK